VVDLGSDYEEALRRIAKVAEDEGKSLNLGGLDIVQVPEEVATLKGLEVIEFDSCWRLNDLTALSGLSVLRELNLSRCR